MGGEFKGQTDPQKCNLGKWLNSFETENEELAAYMTEIHKYHNAVHESGEEISRLLVGGADNRDKAMSIYSDKTLPNMDKVMELLEAMDGVAVEADDLYEAMVEHTLYVTSDAFVETEALVDELVGENQKTIQEMDELADRKAAFASFFS